jgi:hypothetical protein
MTNVAVVQGESYDTQVVEQAMQDCSQIGASDGVLVEPNMLKSVEKELSVTIHP